MSDGVAGELEDGEIDWGCRITLSDGSRYVETTDSRIDALVEVAGYNRANPDRPQAELVRRMVIIGAWAEGVVGDEWGVRRQWNDGYIEVEDQYSRHRAETTVDLYQRDEAKRGVKATVVSRKVTYGEWISEGSYTATDL